MNIVLVSPVDFSMIEWRVKGDSTKTSKQLLPYSFLLFIHFFTLTLSPFPTFSFYLLNVAGRLQLPYNFQSINQLNSLTPTHSLN